MTLDIGDKAPDFSLPTDGGGTASLKALMGRKLVLYFYPKDDTPGCTTEACGFRDALPDFSKTGAEIIGVSKDSVARHDKFKAKYDLPFTLVADEDGTLCEAYGVWQEKKNYGKTYMGIVRSTFLIDEKGVIAAVWRNLRVKGHVEKVLEAARG
ncbi:MAG: thioredoxin-dependent thiol peroxidase [Rhodospirillaceae bacterium]|jgi:peroxiredoxin Q/BCP|nr:thioredoxin-dependent thiol peroxidase [Rhodospirillaceae bacterium]MBT5051574.1 thioredoxin-dependent thiol peroxidase [Rhodospirillaceae bacterium]MBT5458684.1 thioredoxin-dependent thiol peroxidase [Rhodospirillaceae bacterium]